MSSRPPRVSLNSSDKNLLKMVASLILGDDSNTNNVGDNEICLSDHEARQLISLLESLLNNPDFLTSSRFLKSLTGGLDEKIAEKIYREKILQTTGNDVFLKRKWLEFKKRIGIKGVDTFQPVEQMHDAKFLSMELKVFEALDIHPDVIGILMGIANAYSNVVYGFSEATVRKVDTEKKVRVIYDVIKETGTVCKDNLISIMFIIANASVLFTTRDWSAASTFSQMIGEGMKIIKPQEPLKL